MDDDLRNAFATLSAQISTVNTDLRANTALTAELSRGVADVRNEQKVQAGRIGVIEKHVFGSDPPPPPTRPMAESIGEHAGDIATLSGQIIALHGKVDTIAAKPDTTDRIIEEFKGAAKTPTGQKVIGGFVSVLLLVLALLGAKLQSQLDHIEKQQDKQQSGGAK